MVKFTQEGVEAQEKGKRIPKFHFNKFNDYGGGVILLHGSTVHKIVSRIKSGWYTHLDQDLFPKFSLLPMFQGYQLRGYG